MKGNNNNRSNTIKPKFESSWKCISHIEAYFYKNTLWLKNIKANYCHDVNSKDKGLCSEYPGFWKGY